MTTLAERWKAEGELEGAHSRVGPKKSKPSLSHDFIVQGALGWPDAQAQ
jgi:hypothetical protein